MSQDQHDKIVLELKEIVKNQDLVLFGSEKLGIKGLVQQMQENTAMDNKRAKLDEERHNMFLQEIKALSEWKEGIQAIPKKITRTVLLAGSLCSAMGVIVAFILKALGILQW